MDRTKINGYLSIARKGGNVILGSDNLKGYTKKLYLILIDKNAGKNAMKIAENLAKEKEIEITQIENLPEILGQINCKVCGIKNKNLSEIIFNLIKEK